MTFERLVGRAVYELRGDVQSLKGDLGRAEGEIAKSGASAERKIKAAGTAMGVALGGVAVAALKTADAYDDAMDRIRVGTGATGDDLAALEKSFGRVAGRVPDDLSTVGQALADISTRTGATGEDLERLTERILDLSRITRTDAATNVANLTRLFGDWSIQTSDQDEALDKLFRTSQLTGVGIDTLSQKVVAFGAPLRALNFSFDESIALLGKWEREGVNVETILSGLRMAVANFARQGIDPREGLPALVREIESADEATGLLAAKQIVGQRAANDFFRAVKEGRLDIDDLVGAIQDGSDTIETATQDTEGLGEAFRALKNQVAVVAGPIVRDLAGIGSELGNLVFLLPALGGLLGRGLASAWIRAGGAGRVRAAARAAGAAAGLVYQGAAFIVSRFTDAMAGAWVAMGRPGGRVLQAAMASGRLAGLAFAAAAATAVASIALVVESSEAPRELTRVRDLQKAIEDMRAKPPKDPWGLGTVADTLRILEVELAAVEAGNIALADAVRAGEVSANEATATLATMADQADETGTAVGAVGDELEGTGDAADAATPQMVAVGEASSNVAQRFGILRRSLQDALQEWRALADGPNQNRKSIKALNEAVDIWERKYLRALKNGREDLAALALQQLESAEADRERRRESRQTAQQQNRDINAVSDALGVSRVKAARIYRRNQGDLDKIAEKFGVVIKRATEAGETDPDIKVTTPGAQAAIDRLRELASLAGLGGLASGVRIPITTSMVQFGPRGRTKVDINQHGGFLPAGRWSMVGEAGRELIRLGTDARVFSNPDTERMLSGSMSVVEHRHTITAEGAQNLRAAGYSATDVGAMLGQAAAHVGLR